LIGINSQIVPGAVVATSESDSRFRQMARTVMDQLVKNEKVRRGQLGIVVSR
jgi:hypothetical protein